MKGNLGMAVGVAEQTKKNALDFDDDFLDDDGKNEAIESSL